MTKQGKIFCDLFVMLESPGIGTGTGQNVDVLLFQVIGGRLVMANKVNYSKSDVLRCHIGWGIHQSPLLMGNITMSSLRNPQSLFGHFVVFYALFTFVCYKFVFLNLDGLMFNRFNNELFMAFYLGHEIPRGQLIFNPCFRTF